jgi:DDE superfamily endonuclease
MSLKKNTVSRQASIRAALTFLETQKTNSDPILSVRRVALEHGIAEQTLRDAVNRGGVPKRPGPPTILTANEENELVGYCLNMQKMGFGLTKAAVNTMIMQILAANNRTHPFKNGPGYKWWKRFMCDHPQLSFRVPQELSKARAAKGNPTVIQNHFITFKQLIHEHSLTADKIWNMDECGFNISARLQKVLAQKNTRQVHKTAAGSSKEHISVCPTISAAGTYILPLLIYKGVNVIEGLLSGTSVPSGTVAGFTNTGYMHENIFGMFIEHFNHSIPPARPVLLMLDGATSHIDLISINYCRNNGILLYVLPSNTTHLLQPSEIPFKKLKSEYNKASDRYRLSNNLRLVTKYSFAQVFGEAFHETYTPKAIKNAYAATGIWPWNPDAINPSRLAPSLATHQPIALSLKPIHAHDTRTNKIIQLEHENEKLHEYIQRLEHPGTISLASIMRYPYPKSISVEEKPQTRSKAFKFGTLVTAESIIKELEDKENAKKKKIEDIRLRKEQRIINKMAKKNKQNKSNNK